ncbi:TetR/AcrR family transcriptional regulator [Pseudomonas batumici]|uniref:Transcriptional regulator, TetR family n=1 Tax=Pseudomonas batumici TaxID=226910 RepID=A0A0C2EE03_9PSED|nr:TetR/AcrR family transcriptional regulator [Pseudomonas batumici]KIH84159.1 Transcriptional regulator, TetR family [Pseudomonas batumici]
MKDTKSSIIECAFRLFLEHGYENTSLSNLVKASGLSKGAFYHHFKDKEALHDATIHYFFIRFFTSAEPEEVEPLKSEPGLEEIVGELYSGYSHLIAEIATITPDLSAYYRFLFSILPKIKPVIAQQIAAARLRIASSVRRDQDQGRFSLSLSPDVVADQCLALIEGAGLLCVLEGKESIDTVFRRTIPTYLKSLRAIAVN